eukprot:Pgem_evm1s7717
MFYNLEAYNNCVESECDNVASSSSDNVASSSELSKNDDICSFYSYVESVQNEKETGKYWRTRLQEEKTNYEKVSDCGAEILHDQNDIEKQLWRDFFEPEIKQIHAAVSNSESYFYLCLGKILDTKDDHALLQKYIRSIAFEMCFSIKYETLVELKLHKEGASGMCTVLEFKMLRKKLSQCTPNLVFELAEHMSNHFSNLFSIPFKTPRILSLDDDKTPVNKEYSDEERKYLKPVWFEHIKRWGQTTNVTASPATGYYYYYFNYYHSYYY